MPAAKRTNGYYVLPILHNGRFVGRLDPKADRKNKIMIVRHLYLEPDVKVTEQLVTGIASALREFMDFYKSETVRIEQSEPAALKAAVLNAI